MTGSDPEYDRRTFIRATGATGVVGTTTMLAGCSGDDGGNGNGNGNGGNGNGQGNGDDQTETPTAEPSQISTGGKIVVALQSDPWTMHPHMYQDTSSAQLANNYGNRLVRTDNEGQIYPDLAAEMPEVSDDGTSYTFTIREGVKFHGDYGEVTAETVVENYHTILQADYGSPARADYEGILVGEGINPQDTVQATGDYEVTFNLPEPYSPFLYKLADGRMTVIPPEVIDEHGEDLGNPDVGIWSTGPFVFESAQPDNKYVFSKNEDYFKETDAGQLPYLDEIEFRIVPEDSVRKTSIQTGEIHISEQVPAKDVEDLRGRDGVEVLSRPGTSQINLYVNSRTFEPLTKADVRKALGHASNRDAQIQTKFMGLAEKGWSMFPPWHWAYDGDAITKYQHDPDKAQSLLESAGESGLSFNCSPTNQPLFVDTAQILQQSYQQVGVNMEITPKEKSAAWEPTIGAWDPKAFEPKDKVGPPSDYHSHIEDITYGFDADGYSYITFHTDAWLNVSYYSDDEVDTWLEDARKSTSREERKELYSKAQAKVSEDYPQIMQTWWNVNQGLLSSVKNFNLFPSFDVELEDVWLDE